MCIDKAGALIPNTIIFKPHQGYITALLPILLNLLLPTEASMDIKMTFQTPFGAQPILSIFQVSNIPN